LLQRSFTETAELKRFGAFSDAYVTRHMRVCDFPCCAGDPCKQPKQLSDDDMEPCTLHRGYDYFAGSEISYITAVTSLALVPFRMSHIIM